MPLLLNGIESRITVKEDKYAPSGTNCSQRGGLAFPARHIYRLITTTTTKLFIILTSPSHQRSLTKD